MPLTDSLRLIVQLIWWLSHANSFEDRVAAVRDAQVAIYSVNVGHTDYAGLPLVAIRLGGTWGLVLLEIATLLGALYLARSRRGQPLDPDLAAYVIAIGVLSSKLAGPYSGIFALPALARLGLRPQLAWTPWMASGATWLLELTFVPGILAGALGPPVWESIIAYWFVFAAWPLATSRRSFAEAAPATR